MVTANPQRRQVLSWMAVPALLAALPWQAADAADTADNPVLMVLGDSLSAEYGLSRGEGWVALLEKRLAGDAALSRWKVVNASLSGETTAGGLTRLPQLLQQHRPALVIIELGGNDALRGLPLKASTDNLRQMVDAVQMGMQVPPNYGSAYARQFERMFRKVADETRSPLVPFLLEGFGDDPTWFQPDGIHPQARAHPRMLETVWAVLKDAM